MTRKRVDVEALTAGIPLSSVVGCKVKLTRNGNEFQGLCPFHDEKTPSFTVNDAKGFYHCFGCQANGKHFDFVMETQGVSFLQAAEILGGKAEAQDNGVAPARAREQVDIYAGIVPLPADDQAEQIAAGRKTPPIFNPKRADDAKGGWTAYTPSMVFPYHNAARELVGFVLRIDLAGGAKITPTVRLARLPTGAVAWCLLPFDKPRPLYGLIDVLEAPVNKQVWAAEGEKKRDLLKALGFLAVAWPGGTGGIHHVDWSPLAGRSVLYWPDQDDPGERAMTGYQKPSGCHVAGILELMHVEGAGPIKFLARDHDKPKGWDVADAVLKDGWNKEQVLAWGKPRVTLWTAQPGAPATEAARPTEAEAGTTRPASRTASGGGLSEPRDDEERPAAAKVDERQSPHAPHPTSSQAPFDEPPFDDPGADGDREYDHAGGGPRQPPGPPVDDTEAMRRLGDAPFQILGHNRGRYFFLPKGGQQVVDLSATEMKQLSLLRLAPLIWWTRGEYHFDGKMSWYLAANDLMRLCEIRGVFHPELVRGRGAWTDKGRSVFHAGDAVYVNGEEFEPWRVPSRYIYEAEVPLTARVGRAATNQEANRLVEACQRLTWESKESGLLLAGWCIVAPVCGVLTWRPHIWITGPAGSGKSTALDMIVGQVVGPHALQFEGETTEAAIRQTLRRDARPIVFDEIESEDPRAATRVRSILNLARIASSGGSISKGGSNNVAISYPVRSCFCFSSINTAVKAQADETRISKLVLKRNALNAERHFLSLVSDISAWFVGDYAYSMFARTIEHAATLQENTKVFIAAAAGVLGSRRPADQIGTMLAGLHLCYTTKIVTIEAARIWIEKHYWDEHAAVGISPDEQRLFEHLSSAKIRVRTTRGAADYTIGELIVHAAYQSNRDTIAPDMPSADAENELKMIGVKVLYGLNQPEPAFVIANSSPQMERLLAGTPWAADWKGPLSRLPGARKIDVEYYAPGLRSRGVYLPLSMLMSS